MNRHKAAAASAVLMLGGLIGCGTSAVTLITAPTTSLTPGGATVLYALQQPQNSTTSSLLVYSLSASSSNASPIATITPPNGVYFNCVATDSVGNIYVGSYVIATGQGEVLVYAAGSNGAAVPTRTIYGGLSNDTTTFSAPYSMSINSAGQLAILTYNGNGNAIVTVPASSNGTPVVSAQLYGASTQLYSPTSLAIDSTGKITETDGTSAGVGTVMTFAAGATGNTAPISIITTGTSFFPYGVSVDGSGNIYTVLDSVGSASGSLVEYAAGSNGAASPTATIAGGATGVYYGGGVRNDSVGNVYLINLNSAETAFGFLGFKGGTTGNVGPGLSITAGTLTSPSGEIAVH